MNPGIAGIRSSHCPLLRKQHLQTEIQTPLQTAEEMWGWQTCWKSGSWGVGETCPREVPYFRTHCSTTQGCWGSCSQGSTSLVATDYGVGQGYWRKLLGTSDCHMLQDPGMEKAHAPHGSAKQSTLEPGEPLLSPIPSSAFYWQSFTLHWLVKGETYNVQPPYDRADSKGTSGAARRYVDNRNSTEKVFFKNLLRPLF